MALCVSLIPGIKINARRCVLFIEDDDDQSINAKAAFDDLPLNQRNNLLSRFEHWIDGNIQDIYFHGWNDPERKQCFVFKWRKGVQRFRLYGFLCFPKSPNDNRFQACVLSCYAKKNTEETDPAIIKVLNTLRTKAIILAAIREAIESAPQIKEQDNDVPKELTNKKRGQLDGGKR